MNTHWPANRNLHLPKWIAHALQKQKKNVPLKVHTCRLNDQGRTPHARRLCPTGSMSETNQDYDMCGRERESMRRYHCLKGCWWGPEEDCRCRRQRAWGQEISSAMLELRRSSSCWIGWHHCSTWPHTRCNPLQTKWWLQASIPLEAVMLLLFFLLQAHISSANMLISSKTHQALPTHTHICRQESRDIETRCHFVRILFESFFIKTD